MKQYGDITKLHGYDLDPVALIVGGSPCQDLSVAGKRAGLDGERSGLFLEMIRIIREMREATHGIYPRFALWENVPGAFSSNNGKDFGAVLGEFARLIEPNAPDVPTPKEGWRNSGVLLVGNGSLAWRTHDAQYWGKTIRDSRTGDVLQMGTPQRRRRISLVVDLRGESAAEILFERKGVSGDPEQSGAQGEDPAEDIGRSIDKASKCLNPWDVQSKHIQPENGIAESLYSGESSYGGGESYVMQAISFQERCGKLGGGKGILLQKDHTGTEDVSFTLNTIDHPAVFDPSVHHDYREFNNVSETVRSRYGTGGNNQPLVVATMQGFGDYVESGTASACKSRDYKDATDQVCRIDTEQSVMAFEAFGVYAERQTGSSLKARNDGVSNCDVVVSAKCADDYKGPNRQYVDSGKCQITNNSVRRLTPLECERLQGYPDGWTDIPGATDSKRYKALGNSIALPFWEHLAHRFVEIGEVKTIGSLFDGIGGFPLVFHRAGAETKWTSEIDPFCESVVRYHRECGDL